MSEAAKPEGIGQSVASHYNTLKETGLKGRKESPIFYMRNFNNWMKSVLINEYVHKIKDSTSNERISVKVLDVGCGKGGDLNKWKNSRISYLAGADIAEISIRQAKERYQDLKRRNRDHLFPADYFAADCTKENIRDKLCDPDMQFDLVSCQFAFHYCFESLPQAEMMLRNISQNLKPGGYFIGTTPDAYDIVQRVKNTPGKKTVSNKIYSITFDEPLTEDAKIPLFGAKYNFHLEGVVDCPEFLVHFPTLVKLAEKFNLMLIAKRRFGNYFAQNKETNKFLLNRMNSLETYPAENGAELMAEDDDKQYKGAKDFLSASDQSAVGTMSLDEWEAASLYLVFAFKKMRSEN